MKKWAAWMAGSVLLACGPLWACGSAGGDGGDEDAALDVGEDAEDTATPADDAAGDTAFDAAEAVSEDVTVHDPAALAACEAACGKLTGCERLSPEACVAGCLASPTDGCGQRCLELSWDCALVEACLDVRAPVEPMADGPFGTGWRDRVGPQTLPTTAGGLALEDHWNGVDSFVFLLTSGGQAYMEAFWASDVGAWLASSPPNVHYVFLSYPDQDGVDRAAANVAAMKARVEAAIGDKVHRRCQWERRLHYVPVEARQVGGWVGELLKGPGLLGFAVDPAQRLRQLGSVHSLLVDEPLLSHLGYEVAYFGFERAREAALAAAGPVTEVVLNDGALVHDAILEASLPGPAEMAAFDTLEVDLGAFCPGHEDANCGEWDYLSHLWVCDAPGANHPDSGASCAAGAKLVCGCEMPGGGSRDGAHTCGDDGTFGACECPCDHEMTRWITTYRREGRWVTDVSPFLAWLGDGGQARFRYAAGNPLEAELKLRLSNRGKGARPAAIVPLFTGGAFDAGYNGRYEPRLVEVPAWAQRVELVAVVTGHGFGVEAANCAEFCNHTHHFTVDGHEVVEAHPEAGTTHGCAARVGEGVVPNQYGTWTLGRGGWCPGEDVRPFVADVTAWAQPGAAVEVGYEALLGGVDYVPQPVAGGNGGFPARIDLASYLVFYE